MIVYKDILQRLSDAGYTAYRIQKEKILPNSTMDRIRNGKPINTTSVDTICRLCECQPGDLIGYKKDGEE